QEVFVQPADRTAVAGGQRRDDRREGGQLGQRRTETVDINLDVDVAAVQLGDHRLQLGELLDRPGSAGQRYPQLDVGAVERLNPLPQPLQLGTVAELDRDVNLGVVERLDP